MMVAWHQYTPEQKEALLSLSYRVLGTEAAEFTDKHAKLVLEIMTVMESRADAMRAERDEANKARAIWADNAGSSADEVMRLIGPDYEVAVLVAAARREALEQAIDRVDSAYPPDTIETSHQVQIFSDMKAFFVSRIRSLIQSQPLQEGE